MGEDPPDLPAGIRVSEVAIPAGIKLAPRFDNQLLGGVTVLEGSALRQTEGDWSGGLFRLWKPDRGAVIPVRLIPYCAWANRGVSHMTIWMPRVL